MLTTGRAIIWHGLLGPITQSPPERDAGLPGRDDGETKDHKMSYRKLFFMTHGKVPGFGLNLCQFAAQKVL